MTLIFDTPRDEPDDKAMRTRKPVLYYSHPAFLAHDTGPGHPESADRLRAIDKVLSTDDFGELHRVEPVLNESLLDKVALVHDQAMIETVLNTIPHRGLAHLDQDTVVSAGSGNAALLAVAAVCDAIDRLCTDQARAAFCAVRPPGHHAEPNRAMGFCLFNTVAIAAEYARTRYGIPKIAIVDFDVHHGNGTQATFSKQAGILYASTHQMPHYPGTGHPNETGVGNIVNVPLAAGTSGSEFRQQYEAIILPALRQFKPELLLISAGFDAHRDDPLADIALTADDYRWITRRLTAIADEFGRGRILSVLEGGYHLKALADSVAAHVKSLMQAYAMTL